MFVADWVIFILSLLATMSIGIYHAFSGGKQKTTFEYFLGNRKLHFLPVSASLAASFCSPVAILGLPAEAYTNGIMVMLFSIGSFIAFSLTIVLCVPVFHPLKLTSVNEYLKQRFQSRFVSILATLASVIGMVLYASLSYIAPATVIGLATGFPTWAAIIISSLITIIYTSIGGIKAVIWTDVFQVLIMVIGILTCTIQSIIMVGSISEVADIAKAWERFTVSFDPDPTIRLTFWSTTIGMSLHELTRYGTQQAAVQRYCSIPTLTKAKLSVLIITPIVAVLSTLAALSGISMFAYYAKLGCDPIQGNVIRDANQLIPYFLKDTLNYPGVQGMLFASIASASLSTASSALNSSSAIVWKDIVCLKWSNLSEKWNVATTKLLVVFLGMLSTGLGCLLANLGGTFIQIGVMLMSSCGGPLTAMFLLGILFPFANWMGASVGGIAGFIFAIWIGIGSYTIKRQYDYLPSNTVNCGTDSFNFTGDAGTTTHIWATTSSELLQSTNRLSTDPLSKLYSVSYLWIACFSIMVAMLVGVVVSLITGGMKKNFKPELLHPWVRRFYHTDSSQSRRPRVN